MSALLEDITEESVTIEKEGDVVYTGKIKELKKKAESWWVRKRGFEAHDHDKYVGLCSNPFSISSGLFQIKVHPASIQQSSTDPRDYVSVKLVNKSDDQLLVSFTISIGTVEEIFTDKVFNSGIECGNSKMLHHSQITSNDDNHVVKCKFTKVWNLTEHMIRSISSAEEKYLNSNNNNTVKPRCPTCFEEMSSKSKIAQCISGHLLCWSCKERLGERNCAFCDQPVNGRAFGMENYLRSIFG